MISSPLVLFSRGKVFDLSMQLRPNLPSARLYRRHLCVLPATSEHRCPFGLAGSAHPLARLIGLHLTFALAHPKTSTLYWPVQAVIEH